MRSSTLYERNLFYQQLNFKYVLLQYVQSLVWELKPGQRIKTLFLLLLYVLIYLLDFIIGTSLFVYLQWNPPLKELIGTTLSLYTTRVLDMSKDYITWLMGVPWGIKLNTPLNHFLGTRYLYILDLWRMFYSEFICSYLSIIIEVLVFLLPFGLTVSITALHDFMKFLNLCLICFFIISSRIFTLQVSALKSLGRLFMGKKWNILRKRVDSCDFDMNQLLIGTLIFTILLFLLPTTGMYVLAFLYLRIIQFSVQLALRLCAVVVNKLTIFVASYLHSSLQDQPISKASVRIRGMTPNQFGRKKVVQPHKVVPGKRCKLECFKVDQDDITILWNGQEYSVEEFKAIVNSMSTEDLANDLDKVISPSDGAENTIEAAAKRHSMVHLIWTLPKN